MVDLSASGQAYARYDNLEGIEDRVIYYLLSYNNKTDKEKQQVDVLRKLIRYSDSDALTHVRPSWYTMQQLISNGQTEQQGARIFRTPYLADNLYCRGAMLKVYVDSIIPESPMTGIVNIAIEAISSVQDIDINVPSQDNEDVCNYQELRESEEYHSYLVDYDSLEDLIADSAQMETLPEDLIEALKLTPEANELFIGYQGNKGIFIDTYNLRDSKYDDTMAYEYYFEHDTPSGLFVDKEQESQLDLELLNPEDGIIDNLEDLLKVLQVSHESRVTAMTKAVLYLLNGASVQGVGKMVFSRQMNIHQQAQYGLWSRRIYEGMKIVMGVRMSGVS